MWRVHLVQACQSTCRGNRCADGGMRAQAAAAAALTDTLMFTSTKKKLLSCGNCAYKKALYESAGLPKLCASILTPAGTSALVKAASIGVAADRPGAVSCSVPATADHPRVYVLVSGQTERSEGERGGEREGESRANRLT